MGEYVRIGGRHEEGLFIVLRVLFDVPKDPGYMPPMLVGAPVPLPPNDDRATPRYPVVLVDDIPFNLAAGYNLAGAPQLVTEHLDYFRRHGSLRAAPLSPPPNVGQLERDLWASRQMTRWMEECAYSGKPMSDWERRELRSLARDQILRLARPVFHAIPPGNMYAYSYLASEDKNWPRNAAALNGVQARWSDAEGRYTLQNGKVLPDPDAGPFRSYVWRVKFDGDTRFVRIQRADSRYVDFGVTGFVNGRTATRGTFRLVVVGHEGKALVEVSFPKPTFEGGAWGTGAVLPKGTRVRAELVVPNGILKSPEMVP
jgi:hypothetical protein